MPATLPPPSPHKEEATRGHGRLYGRRRGRRLRPGQAELMERLLPRLTLPVPASGAFDLAAAFGPEFAPGPAGRPCPWLEIGFGAGEHLAAQAAAHPQVPMIGCEAFVNGIATLLATIERQGLSNIRLFPDDARTLLAALPEDTLERVFILFPDPWPKRRHAGRRLISPATLDALARVMRPGGVLRLATDDPVQSQWMLGLLLSHGGFVWEADSAEDWRRRPRDWPPTRYEEKARRAGRSPVFLVFRRAAPF